MRSFFTLSRLVYVFTPWLAEASAFSLVVPLVLGAEPFTPSIRALVFLVVLIVGSYYDRKLWQSYSDAAPRKKPALQAGQVIFPVLFYLLAGFVFNLVVVMTLPKLLVVAVIISVAKYLIFELQSWNFKN